MRPASPHQEPRLLKWPSDRHGKLAKPGGARDRQATRLHDRSRRRNQGGAANRSRRRAARIERNPSLSRSSNPFRTRDTPATVNARRRWRASSTHKRVHEETPLNTPGRTEGRREPRRSRVGSPSLLSAGPERGPYVARRRRTCARSPPNSARKSSKPFRPAGKQPPRWPGCSKFTARPSPASFPKIELARICPHGP